MEIQEKELRIRELEVKPDNSFDADNIIRKDQLSRLTNFIQRQPTRWSHLGSALGFSEEELYNIQRKVNPHFSGAIDLTLPVDYMSESILQKCSNSGLGGTLETIEGAQTLLHIHNSRQHLWKLDLEDIVRDLPSYDDLKESN